MAILYEKKDKVAIITINRPDARIAIDPETSEELGKAWLDFIFSKPKMPSKGQGFRREAQASV